MTEGRDGERGMEGRVRGGEGGRETRVEKVEG